MTAQLYAADGYASSSVRPNLSNRRGTVAIEWSPADGVVYGLLLSAVLWGFILSGAFWLLT